MGNLLFPTSLPGKHVNYISTNYSADMAKAKKHSTVKILASLKKQARKKCVINFENTALKTKLINIIQRVFSIFEQM